MRDLDFNNENEISIEGQEKNVNRALWIIMNYDVRVANSIFRIKKFINNAVMIQILFNLSCLVFILLLWQARGSSGELYFLIKIACVAFFGSLVSWLAWGLWIVPRRIKKQKQDVRREMKFIANIAGRPECFVKIHRGSRKSDFN